MAGLDWAEILRRAGIPEPPGRAELIAAINDERAKQHRRAAQGPASPGAGLLAAPFHDCDALQLVEGEGVEG